MSLLTADSVGRLMACWDGTMCEVEVPRGFPRTKGRESYVGWRKVRELQEFRRNLDPRCESIATSVANSKMEREQGRSVEEVPR
eukprot:scaffold32561_cov32-Cyclotella_meneghiniana.AAC.3